MVTVKSIAMTDQLKILYLEDSDADAEIVSRFLTRSIQGLILKQVDNKKDYEETLTSFSPDIILSDHSLYQFDSIEALSILKQNKLNIPFILVTGTVSEEFAVTILKEGAVDYVLKNNLSRLPIAIQNALKEKSNIIEKENYQRKLLEKNKELNTLIYKITHDLRGPVCSILGLVELARKADNEPDFDYLEKIATTTLKLDTILHSLTETMYASDAAVKPDSIEFDILLTEILEKFEFIDAYKKVTIFLNISAPYVFYSDKRILTSILQNIIENSFKYRNLSINNPFIQIQITFSENHSVIIVEDNGNGINPEIEDKIFDMFFRGNSDSSGSGLGLYLVKKGVDKLNGNIEIKSKPREGTRITLKFPSMKA